MNIEADRATLDELEHGFKFNDAIIRHLIVTTKKAESTPSPMMKDGAPDASKDAPRESSRDAPRDAPRDASRDEARKPAPVAEEAPTAA